MVDRDGLTRLEVCNRDSNKFERTEPRQYTAWLVEQNLYSGKNSFRKCTRLIKYLRDIKTRFTCSSVLLTTLLGYCIHASDKGSVHFADTPTSLKTLFGRLDDWLQANQTKLTVANPFLQSENFADAWTDDQYSNFRDKINTYRQWIDDAYNEQDRSESIAKWRRVFGEDFASTVVLNEGKGVSKAVVAEVRSQMIEASQFTGDLVDAIKRFGSRVLPTGFNKQAHMEAPKWKRSPSSQQVSVLVRADLHESRYGPIKVRAINSLQPLKPGHWLHFKAETNGGLPLDPAFYTVHWRVTNTDEAAALAHCLRGKIESSHSDNSRWEQLRYRGVHLVEAIVINKRSNLIVGQSEAIRVMIE